MTTELPGAQPLHNYSQRFFDYIELGSRRSARIVAPLVAQALGIRSLLDVGCGRGAWLREWIDTAGVKDVMGIDGDYVDRSTLLVPGAFMAHDLKQPFELDRRFDLVTCLEVAEHMPKSAASTIVNNLVRHADMVLFSAALPGQGGENHVNEQPLDFWRQLFKAKGYSALDWLRPQIAANTDVEYWYRYNTILYVKDEALPRLPENVRAARADGSRPLKDISPLPVRLQRLVIGALPAPVVTRIARMKHQASLRLRHGATD